MSARRAAISDEGAVVLTSTLRLIGTWLDLDGADWTAASAGPWHQDSWNGYPGKLRQSVAAASGTPLDGWVHSTSSDLPARLVAVHIDDMPSAGYGDLATHVAVMGGWKLVVAAIDANPTVDAGRGLVAGARILGAVPSATGSRFRIPSVEEAANAVLASGFSPQKFAGDPAPPSMITCDPCRLAGPLDDTYRDHNLFAHGQAFEDIKHIADLLLRRDGHVPQP